VSVVGDHGAILAKATASMSMVTRERGELVVQESFPSMAPATTVPTAVAPAAVARAVATDSPVTATVRPGDDDVLTVDELVAWLRLSESTVLKLLSERVIPARKVGHQWRVRRGKVRDWLDGRE
jgi:excisionase family DNA binding protein